MDSRLIELATAVADGAAIDWSSWAETLTRPGEQRMLAELEVLQRVAETHLQSTSRSTSADRPDASATVGGIGTAGMALSSWGDLTKLKPIGRGSFGDVYRAHDPRLDRPVALKILRRREHHQESLDSAVIREGRLLARVRHPNVVTVFGADRIDGRVGIWMEFVEGRTLEADVRAQGPLANDDVVRIGIDLCRALEAVHRAGLLHRDLKAQNVMRDADGRVLLTDFGAGRDLTSDGDPAHELAGTPLYLAPEVLEGAPVSPASDVYSLGVLVFYLFTRSFPVRGRSLRDIRDAHALGPRTPLDALRPDLPKAIVSVVARALEPDPSRRFPSAQAFETALLSLVPHAGSRRRHWIVAASLLAAAAVAVVTMVIPGRNRSDANVVAEFRRLSPAWMQRAIPRSVAPDGRWILCFEQMRLSRCDIATGLITSIGDGRAPAAPFGMVSPDGQRVLYLRVPTDGEELRVVNVDGTADRLLHKINDGRSIRPNSWSGDGSTVAALTSKGPAFSRWMVFDASTGSVRATIDIDRPGSGAMLLSADGQSAVFGQGGDVWMLDVATGSHTSLIAGVADESPMLLSASGDLFFTSNRSGSKGIWRVTIRDRRMAGAPSLVRDLRRARVAALGLTANGDFVHTLDSMFDVYAGELDLASATVIETPSLVARNPELPAAGAAWSPDGRFLAFLTPQTRTNAFPSHINVRRLEDGAEHRFDVPNSYYQTGLQWSADGRSLLLSGGRNIIRRDATTGETLGTQTLDRNGAAVVLDRGDERAWFRGGGIRTHDFQSQRGTVVYDLRPGESLSSSLALSADSQRLAFAVGSRAPKPWHVVRVLDTSTGAMTDAFTSSFPVEAGTWSRDGRFLLFARQLSAENDRAELAVLSWPSREIRALPIVMDQIRDIRLHPDDRRVAFVAGSASVELWVVNRVTGGQR